MKHTYQINGMSCIGCKTSVEQAISELSEIQKITIDLQKSEAMIEMSSPVSVSKLQDTLLKAGLHYTIEMKGDVSKNQTHEHHHNGGSTEKGNGIFYCPMHCEGEKIYSKPGDCPVCGMDLIEQPQLNNSQQYTCPMHPEIVKDRSGSCPICGMDLVPLEPNISAEQKVYKDLAKKMIIATSFAVPVFVIAMSDLIPGNPLAKIMSQQSWNWIQFVLTLPIVFYACWMFFVRAWKSIITWNLNMFTLVGIGTGVAFLFSLIGLLFPNFSHPNLKQKPELFIFILRQRRLF